MSDPSLDDIRQANKIRRDSCLRLHCVDWTLNDWATALAGEVGEACNVMKKIRRGDVTLDEARPALASEFADVLGCLDILAAEAGIDLADAYVAKFNAVSDRYGSAVKLRRETRRRHEWAPSRVGHGEAQCIRCLITNREAMAIAPEFCP